MIHIEVEENPEEEEEEEEDEDEEDSEDEEDEGDSEGSDGDEEDYKLSDEKDLGKAGDTKPNKDASSDSEYDSDDDRTKEERAYDKAKRRIEVFVSCCLCCLPQPFVLIRLCGQRFPVSALSKY